MKRSLVCFTISIFLAATSFGQYVNIMISDIQDPNEPAIVINPKNPNQMVAGANIASYYYSDDAGYSWNRGVLNSSYGVWGDPCLVADTNGNFYFLHLSNPPSGSWIDRIVCQRSVNGGLSWNNGSFMGLNGIKVQDKEWAVVDPDSNYIYVCWTQFDHYGSSNPSDSSIILFSRSVDGGENWSDPHRINQVAGDCLDSDYTVMGAVPAVGPAGEIYVSWAGPDGIVFTRSLDGGITWPEINRVVTDIPGGWDYMIPGIYRSNGLPVTCCDRSGTQHHGTIYINWSDQRNGSEDTDVWLIRSTDGGVSWSDVIRVNDDPPGRQQFFTWMAIDQKTGFLYVVFYDRRNYTDYLTDVYMAVSKNGGETFENFKVSETPFYPNAGPFFGDYTNIAVHDQIVRPVWARLDSYQLSVWTAIVDSLYVGVTPGKINPVPFSLEQNYPNPVYGYTNFAYKIHVPSYVTLKIFDVFGNEVARVIDNRFHVPGKYVQGFNLEQQDFPAGFYYFSLISSEQTIQRKMIVE